MAMSGRSIGPELLEKHPGQGNHVWPADVGVRRSISYLAGSESLSLRHTVKTLVNQALTRAPKRRFVATVCSVFCSADLTYGSPFSFAFLERSAPAFLALPIPSP